MNTHVTILLSTWNGARHLADQLRSYDAQTHPDWDLRWRDDGSRDRTRDILAAFGRGGPLADDGRALGVAGSFTSLLRAHLAEDLDAIVAFSDQDDVWLPEKLARGVAALARIPADVPALYCARQHLVDDALDPIGLSPAVRHPPAFPNSLTENIATGCTVMLNPAAQRLAARDDPPDGTLHDWWACLLVTAAGGLVICDPEPTILYRQHGGNAVGAPRSAARRALAAARRGPGRFMTVLRNNVAALSAVADRLSPEAGAVLAEIGAALQAGPAARVRFLVSHRLRRQTIGETMLFRLWFVLG